MLSKKEIYEDCHPPRLHCMLLNIVILESVILESALLLDASQSSVLSWSGIDVSSR